LIVGKPIKFPRFFVEAGNPLKSLV
jgi:hypothetical protein